MKKSKNRIGLTTAAEMAAIAPPVDPIEALRRNLLFAMFEEVKEDDMKAIVRSQVDKAKDGNTKAADFITGMVIASGGRTSPTHMQQAIVMQPNAANRGNFISDCRHQMVYLLACNKPQPTLEIAKAMLIDQEKAALALDHPWFEKQADGWHITAQARAEVLANESLESHPVG